MVKISKIGLGILFLVIALLIFRNFFQNNFDEGCSKNFPHKTICGEGTEYEEECCCNSKSRWYEYNELFNVGEKLRDVGGICVTTDILQPLK